MTTELTLVSAEKHLTLYNNMRDAIADCHRIDECKELADRSVALAAYYKQIKDDETVQRFNEVRLRAWRRIGELMAEVDVSDCETQTAKIKKIRAAFDPGVIVGITDSRIREILQLSAVPDKEFEAAFDYALSGSITDLIQHTPTYLERVRQNAWNAPREVPPEDDEANDEQRAELLAQQQAELRETARRKLIEERHLEELDQASEAAMEEVGITLERKDRANMKQVVFLIKEEVHAVMRRAAFDQKITMQEILRRGLKMWLIAHDYTFPE